MKYRALSTLVLALAAGTVEARAGETALTLLAGQLSETSWDDLLADPFNIEMNRARLLGVAYAHTLTTLLDGDAGVELEGQVVKHFRGQDHWEFNLPVVLRWHRFPWNETVRTSLAFGVGPSYATELPPMEVALKGGSEKLLFHWFIELTLGPPKDQWAASMRLFHRSTGFGALGDRGGSDYLTLGVRLAY